MYYHSPVVIIMGAAGGLQEACFRIQKKNVKGGKTDWIKCFIWFPWIGIIALMAVKAGGFQRMYFMR